MDTSHFQTEKVTSCCNKTLELPFSLSKIEEILTNYQDDFEVTITETYRIKPSTGQIKTQNINIDLSCLEIQRTKPSA